MKRRRCVGCGEEGHPLDWPGLPPQGLALFSATHGYTLCLLRCCVHDTNPLICWRVPQGKRATPSFSPFCCSDHFHACHVFSKTLQKAFIADAALCWASRAQSPRTMRLMYWPRAHTVSRSAPGSRGQGQRRKALGRHSTAGQMGSAGSLPESSEDEAGGGLD